MTSLLKNYNFLESESKWQDYWKKEEVYKWDENTSREETYSIDTPPPTVSGQLHMGHIYSYTQADFIARFQRMSGKNVFYPIGFDDNGLPTERLVEKKKNIKAVNTDRAEFIKICQEIVDEEEDKFEKLFTSVALSVDWNLKYQSISPLSSHISQLSFLDLVGKGEIYRAEQPILWDPIDQTALAQADIEDKEKESAMHDIIFSSTSGKELVIATTRPELLPACVAVLYHPDDERYKNLAGSFAISPLFKVKVPLIADEQVLPDKGTGLVMCCTFGDTTDIDWWKKHKLPLRLILDKRGRIKQVTFDENCTDLANANSVFGQLIGLKVNEARAKILELLSNENLILKSVPITHTVKCAERSGAPLEIITAPQWFVKTISHKEELLERSKELNWHPTSMKIRLDNWINSINWDWCISRQRFFGVPFPVWYSKRAGEEGKAIFASPEQLPVNPFIDLPKGYSRDEVIADPDVMDTWATSSVSPQLASHAITKELSVDYQRHAKLFPFDLRPQAHEILRTWAFYTILKSHLHENSLPWTNIMISGWCLAEDRTKMSKSKGNIVSPEKLLEQHGSDAVRYWASTSRLGADTAMSEDTIKNGKKLVNKLWNAAKFAAQHFTKIDGDIKPLAELLEQKTIYCQADLWILSKLQKVITIATEQFKNYEYSLACSAAEHFFWQDFCDNYLEISKARCYDESGTDAKGQLSGVYSLYYTLKTILELFAPIVPHITEELYQAIYSLGHSIHAKGNWPKWNNIKLPEDISQGEQIVTALNLVRKAKAAKSLSIKAPIETMYLAEANFALNLDAQSDLKNVTNTINLVMVEKILEGEIIEEDNGTKISLVF